MFGQHLVEIERLELTTPIGVQTIRRLLGPKPIEAWIGGVKALHDALDELSPLNRGEQARLLGQRLDAQYSRPERRFEGWTSPRAGTQTAPSVALDRSARLRSFGSSSAFLSRIDFGVTSTSSSSWI